MAGAMDLEKKQRGGGRPRIGRPSVPGSATWVRQLLAALLAMLLAFGPGWTPAAGGEASDELSALLFVDVGNADCAAIEHELESFAKGRGLRLALSVKHAPASLDRIEAHEALEAAQAAGKRAEMRDALFRNPGIRGSGLVRLAREIGMDRGAFEDALDNRLFRPRVMQDLAEARGMGVRATPVLFVNGARLDGVEAILKALRTPPPKPPAAWADLEVEVLHLDLEGVPSRGPAEAPVTVVEFTDFRCGFCRINSRALSEIEAAFPGKIRRVFKHCPLGVDEAALLPHRAGMAAMEQGRFWELHHSVMSRPSEGMEDLLRRAAGLGIDTNQLVRRLSGADISARLDRDVEEGRRLGIQATPTTFINGRRVTGRQSVETLKAYVRGALGQGMALEAMPRLSPDSTSLGPMDGVVYVEVFVDLADPGSVALLGRVREFARERPSVRVEFRSVVRKDAPGSSQMHEAALAAAEQGRFWDWCAALAHEPEVPNWPRLRELARGLGVDSVRLEMSARERRHRVRIESDSAEAAERGLGTGAVVMNGTVFHGEPTPENLARHMDEHACCGKAADFRRPKTLPGR